jgi:hypothetical protein
VGGMACQAEGGFKALLDTLDQALTFSLAQACQLHPIAPIRHKSFASPTLIIP